MGNPWQIWEKRAVAKKKPISVLSNSTNIWWTSQPEIINIKKIVMKLKSTCERVLMDP